MSCQGSEPTEVGPPDVLWAVTYTSGCDPDVFTTLEAAREWLKHLRRGYDHVGARGPFRYRMDP